MGDLTTRLLVNLGGNLPQNSRDFARSLDRFSRDGRRSLSRLQRGSAALGRGIDRLGNRYVALATGAAVVGTIRSTVSLQRRFTRLGIQADITGEKLEGLKRRIFEVSQQGDIRIDASELTSAVETIVEKTGDLDFAEENLRNLALAIQATGGSGAEIGALTAELRKFGLTTNGEVAAALDTLATQGKEGAFTLGNLAGQGERLASAYAATGRQGQTAVREIGAVIQVIRQGTGTAEQATTAFEAVLRTLQDADKVKLLQSGGIRIFEPDQPDKMRAINEIMSEIIAKTGGDTLKISQVFDAEAMRAFNAAITEFKQSGAIESLDRFLSIQGDGTQVLTDSQRAADDMAGAVQNLSTAWAQFGDSNLAAPIRDLADSLNSIEPGRLQDLLDTAKNVGIGFGGLLLARKLGVGKAIGFGARKLFGKGAGGSGGLLPGLGGAGAGATPVFVTNWPGGFGGGAGAGGGTGRGGRGSKSVIGRFAGKGAGAGVSRLARAGGAARLGLRGSAPLLALMSLFDVGSTLADSSLSSAQKIQGTSRAAGGLAGGISGAAAGAALGSFVPIIGTAIGGIIGAALGSFGGENLAETIARLITERDGGGAQPEPAEVRAVVELQNAPPGTRVRSVESSVGVDLDVDVGMAMVGP